ncbi:alpha/beta fold hydrolase [Rhizobium paknamense]|uniref:Pimeloyl-ACP methyl ester carboxylesterase n=1 Tax=Rhizobium paknamense TaxID=1206817 RepID=A0ABU0IIS5_9HYPH|nr:alpha/beta fold hydrolase [Rhizobium paknamense]MDQ0458163.1 pimeloyl-ACP methyl ester carboxylesterase [Rhizobium paknamense]
MVDWQGQTPAALPIGLPDCFGLYTEARGAPARQAAVLFLSPWGYEELCTHKLFRLMADGLAARGIASLRFDYPGTGDALDEVTSLDCWRKSIREALSALGRMTGDAPVFLLGHGLGAALALVMADALGDRVAGVVSMAPVASGRAYVRELQFWSRVIDDGLGLPEHVRITDRVAIGGHAMPPAIAEELKRFNVSALLPQAEKPMLFVVRGERPADGDLTEAALALNPLVERVEYQGYDAMVANPAMAVMPRATAHAVVGWIDSKASKLRRDLRTSEAPALLETDGFREEALRFGPQGRLYGVLTEPAGARRGATVLLLNTAYDRHSGWGRNNIDMARKLAQRGIACLRFDPANVGDSPPLPGAPEQVLYSEHQLLDVKAALDLLEARQLLPALAIGRCSGGYLAFRALVEDERIKAACLANPFVFYWDPLREVDGNLSVVPRSLDTYRKLLVSPQTLKRIFSGKVDLKNAARNFARVGWRRFLLKTGLNHVATPEARLVHREVKTAFARLLARNAKLLLLYSENDVGLEHFYQQFGVDGRGLKRYGNAEIEILAGVDHNFSPPAARALYLERVITLATSERLG